MYTLKSISPSTLKLGRRFVVCDAGGGTVDLVGYEVTSIGKIEVKEATEGTGGRCGSSMLNMRFRRHLKQTHGDKYWTDERLVLALNEFESVSTMATVFLDSVYLTCCSLKKTSNRKENRSLFVLILVWGCGATDTRCPKTI